MTQPDLFDRPIEELGEEYRGLLAAHCRCLDRNRRREIWKQADKLWNEIRRIRNDEANKKK